VKLDLSNHFDKCAHQENLWLKTKHQRTTLLYTSCFLKFECLLKKRHAIYPPFEQCPAPFLGCHCSPAEPCGSAAGFHFVLRG
jgi:hypothetical protein